MTLVGVCKDCGFADGGHSPTCPCWQTMSAYEILKGQKDAIMARQKARGDGRAMNQKRIDEIAEQVCWALQLPIRGVAFVYIENAIRAALEEQAHALNARIAALEQLNRDLTTAAVNDGAPVVEKRL